MVRTLRLLLLLLLVAMAGLAWPADAAAQRGPAQYGRVGVAVARPAGGPHGGGYGSHGPYYPARYYPRAYYSYPRYYAPYSWAVGFGFGAGWSASFGIYGYRYGYAYPYRYAVPYPAAYPYPYGYGYPAYGAPVVHVVQRNAPASPQDRSQYDSQASSGAPRPGDQSAFATLSLRVSPADAEILIDGEPWDRANGDIRFTIDLAAGRHQLEVRREGYGAYVRTIDLLGGRTAALNVALTPKEPVPAPARYPASAPVPVRVARR